MNYVRDKRLLQKHDGLSPAEIDEMPYWEFLEFRRLLGEDLKQESDRAREQQSQQQKQSSSFKLPKFSMPKMPKLR